MISTATRDRSTAVSLPTADVTQFDWVVADACWSWTERLFAPLSEHDQRVLLLKACDWRNALEQRLPLKAWMWPSARRNERLWEHRFVLPPGWMKTAPRLGMRPLRGAVRRWRASLPNPRPLALVISYPHYLYLNDLIRPDALVYYNMDDYSLYWRRRASVIERLERRAVQEADLSLFCASIRATELKRLVPSAADRIIHLPHGAPSNAIAAAPQHAPAAAPADLAPLPRPYLGFVGSLEDRVDWRLIQKLAEEFPTGSVILVGRPPKPEPRAAWYQAYSAAIACPNVHVLGWRSKIDLYNAAFDVCLIPYIADHPFNRVSCPTKIMDYMATTRPVVSTNVPECSLYREQFDVAETHDEFVRSVGRIVESNGDDHRAAERWNTARNHTWPKTTAAFLNAFNRRAPNPTRLGPGS